MEEIKTKSLKNRENEKGAVMVTVLLISFLLLLASAGILLETTTNTTNVSDSTADQQAYNAAESGIQSALNVLRGNVAPNPLFNATASNVANKIDFKKALKKSDSNLATDASTEDARLSRWGLTYDSDRVKIGDPAKGYAYKIALFDPDNASSSVTFNTTHADSGFYNDTSNTWVRTMTFGTATNGVVITYAPVTDTAVNVSSGSGTAQMGTFRAVVTGSGASVGSADIRFQMVLKMSLPYDGYRAVRGYIKGGTVINGTNAVKLYFDSPNVNLLGSKVSMTLTTSNATTPEYSLNLSAPVLLVGSTNLTATMTPAEPRRIMIRATGYGPRGSQKQLEAIVQKNYFDGLEAPASLTLIGQSSGFVFNAGNSANVAYSGDDLASTINIPAIGTSNATNLDYVNANLPKSDTYPKPANIGVENPEWLSSAAALDAKIQMLKNVAEASGRAYPNSTASTPPNFGDNYNATGITFVTGNATFSGSGGGILVVTGKLTFNGNVNFSGLIIVTGAGGIDRSGGGGGLLQGNTVVAPYDATSPTTIAAGFLAPKYNISGGGNSTLQYNSNSVANGMTAVSNLVLGVAEK